MSRTSLAERIERAPHGDRPLLLAEACSFAAIDLCRAADTLPLPHDQRRGAVVLRLASPLRLALALIALDGVAERLLLLSSEASIDVATDLIARFDATAMVIDESIAAKWPVAPIVWQNAVSAPLSDGLLRDRRDTAWTLTTSGTTGTPKLVAHKLSSLARATRTSSEFVRELRWGLLYELSRFAGIQVFLQGMLSGGGLIAPDPRSTLAAQVDRLVRDQCTALSATPTLWRKLLMTPEAKGLSLRQVTLGGEIADAAVLAALTKWFPRARIAHIFASTEAGAAFAVADGQAGFPAVYLDEPPAGIRLRVVDGRLFVHNDGVSPAYVGGPVFADSEGFVDTGDVVERSGDRFHFRGRANGAINVGGNKLFPEEVEKLLLAQPQVASARVFGKPNPITGQLVVAEIVLAKEAADAAAVIQVLRAACRAELLPWQVPTSIKVVDHIASNAGTKLARTAA